MRACSVSERRACRALGQVRSTQRHELVKRDPNDSSRQRVIAVATQYGRYGYRQVTSMMRNEGWNVNPKYVYRVWREEGLKVPQKQPKRARLWLSDGSIIRLRAEYPNHVWSYDFVSEQTTDGKKFRILNIIDEYTRECLAAIPARTFKAIDVLYALSELFVQRGTPKHIRSDNGPEFIARILRCWLDELDVECSFITPGSPWENGFVESFNGHMRYEFLNGETFHTLTEATILTEQWRRFYNTIRPHSRLGGKPPAPESIQPTVFLSAA